MLEEQYFHKSWTTCLCMNFVNAWIGTMAIITPAASPVWINFSAWPSHNLRTEKACGILKPVSVHVKRNFIISVFAARISRSTLADANEKRDWRIYADFCQILISQARSLYANEDFGIELDDTTYALDSTTIDLCLSLFPWAAFRKHKAAVKMHTLMDIRGNIPSFIEVTSGNIHDVNILDILTLEPGAFILWIAPTWTLPGSITLPNSFPSSSHGRRKTRSFAESILIP